MSPGRNSGELRRDRGKHLPDGGKGLPAAWAIDAIKPHELRPLPASRQLAQNL